jgi:hypothetical protein
MEAAIVALLAPFLKPLLDGTMRAAGDAVGKASEAVVEHAESVWAKQSGQSCGRGSSNGRPVRKQLRTWLRIRTVRMPRGP